MEIGANGVPGPIVAPQMGHRPGPGNVTTLPHPVEDGTVPRMGAIPPEPAIVPIMNHPVPL